MPVCSANFNADNLSQRVRKIGFAGKPCDRTGQGGRPCLRWQVFVILADDHRVDFETSAGDEYPLATINLTSKPHALIRSDGAVVNFDSEVWADFTVADMEDLFTRLDLHRFRMSVGAEVVGCHSWCRGVLNAMVHAGWVKGYAVRWLDRSIRDLRRQNEHDVPLSDGEFVCTSSLIHLDVHRLLKRSRQDTPKPLRSTKADRGRRSEEVM